MTSTDEPESAPLASAEAGQPEPAAPETPWTLERLMVEEPTLVSEIQAEARAAFAHVVPAPSTRSLIDGAREQGRAAEHARLMAIFTHAEAQGRMPLAIRLCGMDLPTATAIELLAGTSRVVEGQDQFSAMMAKLRARSPAPDEDADDLQAAMGRVRGYDEQMLAERAAEARARGR
jgi:hypothetical protein